MCIDYCCFTGCRGSFCCVLIIVVSLVAGVRFGVC